MALTTERTQVHSSSKVKSAVMQAMSRRSRLQRMRRIQKCLYQGRCRKGTCKPAQFEKNRQQQQRPDLVAHAQHLQRSLDDQFGEIAKLRKQNALLKAELLAAKTIRDSDVEAKSVRKKARRSEVIAESSGHPCDVSRDAGSRRTSMISPSSTKVSISSRQQSNMPASPKKEKAEHTAVASTHDAARSVNKEFQIRVEEGLDEICPAPINGFEELTSLPRYVLDNLRKQGIHSPMPIQAQALPLILAKSDVIGLAQTGSGKTLAFLLPAAVHLQTRSSPRIVQTSVLILAPTRELAVQISDESEKIFANSACDDYAQGVKTVCVYGGGDKWAQTKSLKWGAHIVVATPGRLLDFVQANVVSLSQVDYFVLDEADRMLDMGFHEDVLMIAGRLQQKRQVLFFSATWSHVVQQLALGLCSPGSKPVRISYGQGCSDKGGYDVEAAKHKARTGIVQEVVVIDTVSGPDRWEQQEQQKNKKMYAHLNSVLAASDEHKVLVFVSRKDLADKVSAQLKEKGFKADAMHGGKSQVYRLWVLDQFRQGALRLLVCTDVLGRGIDIPSVSHVVIHEMGEMEDYIHRIGRTARGRYGKGHALVFFEFWEGSPQVARDLIDVLTASKQHVPKELQKIADEVASGRRQARGKSNEWTGKPSRHTAAWSGW
eukprot:gnl/MRDRNA2_/MRDRNA2_29028_c0_seq2.p1 gnl/MRDRNA2_/MRDRNA2_29028_c0~~gnl/MRDRNA2_/MRDRNA2_29028_c0_seq2.p1  ORF type:complete len:658 (+),score=116.78 gnl/MRDRNA2_/MRDRNA2_29028_c0_seq2:124-2097(+)